MDIRTVHTTPARAFAPTSAGQDRENSGTLARKLGLEFLYPTSGVHKSFLTGVSWMGVHGYIAVN